MTPRDLFVFKGLAKSTRFNNEANSEEGWEVVYFHTYNMQLLKALKETENEGKSWCDHPNERSR